MMKMSTQNIQLSKSIILKHLSIGLRANPPENNNLL